MGTKNTSRYAVNFLFAGLATTVSFAANAATVDFYADSANFISHASPTNTIDFENLVGSQFTANYDSGTGYYAQSGITVQGVTFTGTSPYGTETYIVGQAAQDSSIYQLNAGSADLVGGRTRTTMDFQGQNVNAVGFDFMRVAGTSAYPSSLDYAIQLIFDDGSVLNEAATISLSDGTRGYFGVNATGKNISILNFYQNYNFGSYVQYMPYIVFDNVSFKSATTASAVPEPETYAMFLAGLGLVGFVARRRQFAYGPLRMPALVNTAFSGSCKGLK